MEVLNLDLPYPCPANPSKELTCIPRGSQCLGVHLPEDVNSQSRSASEAAATARL